MACKVLIAFALVALVGSFSVSARLHPEWDSSDEQTQRDDADNKQSDHCCLYEHVDFKGRHICFDGVPGESAPVDLMPDFDDIASSIRCTGKAFVVVYADAGGKGDYRVFSGEINNLIQSGNTESCLANQSGPSDDEVLRPNGLNDQISSIQAKLPAFYLGQVAVEIYSYQNFKGGLYGVPPGTVIPVADTCDSSRVRGGAYPSGFTEWPCSSGHMWCLMGPFGIPVPDLFPQK